MLKEIIYQYLEKYPPALNLFHMLEEIGNIYLIGGVLREFKDNNKIINLRDIDIIIDIKNSVCLEKILSKFDVGKNRFGGYKLFCSGLVVDIWSLDETWAYKNQILKCKSTNYVECLTSTVFLNIDAIVYDMKNNIWYDRKYQEAMRSRVLDVVLECNPEVPLNVIRAIMLKKRYDMTYSKRLKCIIKKEMNARENFLDMLMNIQVKRYKREILSKELIENELFQM